ncbi:MAG: Na+/H+ antiporter subunit E [Burkholderiales bacterium]
MSAVIARGAGFLGLWVVLIGFDPVDLAVGVAATAAATWTSLRLLPPSAHRLHLAALTGFGLRFLWQSVVAGVDVARRAFDPRLPLRTGFVVYPTRFPRGPARNTFASVTSLLPGTVPVRDDAQGLHYHCLDVEQPVAAQLAAEEGAVSRVVQQAAQP